MPTRVLEADGIRVRISPIETAAAEIDANPQRVLEAAPVRNELGDARHRLLAIDVDHDDGDAPAIFEATVYDYDNRRTMLVRGPVEDPTDVEIVETPQQPPPHEDELDMAVEILESHDALGAAVRSQRMLPYQAMPPLLNLTRADGTVERRINVGLYAPDEDPSHRFVAVNLATGAVELAPAGAPAASNNDCGVPPRDGCAAGRRSGAVRVRMSEGSQELWDLVVARPRISSGIYGSGIELKDVRYRGMAILRRANVPILNVEYDRSVNLEGCGPTYRDWQDEEACFVAEGQNVQPGYRACPTPAKTIFEDTTTDRGNFRGVAFYIRSRQLFMVSELAAGWYRYKSEWRLAPSGVIRPRFGFGAVRNVCTCKPHHHHAYWRFAFDVDGKPSTVEEFNDPPLDGNAGKWHTIVQETRRRKSPSRQRRWRIRNSDGRGYMLLPGDSDGTADEFGVGDFWVLRRRSGELDDGDGPDRARIGRFVNGQRVDGRGLVLWYAGHFKHVRGSSRDHFAGPQFNPIKL